MVALEALRFAQDIRALKPIAPPLSGQREPSLADRSQNLAGRRADETYWMAPAWREIAAQYGFLDLATLWDFPALPIDAVNRRRGGWSTTAVAQFDRPSGATVRVFIKRQENHFCGTSFGGLRRIPTGRREFQRLSNCTAAGVRVPDLLCYGEWRVGADRRALLVTAAVENHHPLPEVIDRETGPAPGQRAALIRAMASAVRRLHGLGIQHGALYPRHIFIPADQSRVGDPDLVLLDLESARRRWLPWSRCLRDLDTLHRHAHGWTRNERLRFLHHYFETNKLNRYQRLLLKILSIKSRRKPVEY